MQREVSTRSFQVATMSDDGGKPIRKRLPVPDLSHMNGCLETLAVGERAGRK